MDSPRLETSAIVFRPLADVEAEAGYAVICETVEWLRAKGIRLWEQPLPRPIYDGRQARGENFGLFVDGELAVVVSLVAGVPTYWMAEISDPQTAWLCTLATANAFRGRQLGRLAVVRVLEYLAERGAPVVYLDCAPGILQQFYAALGFVRRTQRAIQIPHASPCCEVEAVLMEQSLAQKEKAWLNV